MNLQLTPRPPCLCGEKNTTMKKQQLFILLLFVVTIVTAQKPYPAKYVNPFVGTDFHGHTYPGATVPFGMVQLSPDTRLTGWDGCSGYHFSDSVIYGFSHTHLSGTGCSDLGDILMMPTVGKPELDNKMYSSNFKKGSETAKAGYYSVFLEKPKVRVELTSTARVGFHRYTFPKTKEANIILDLQHRDDVIESWIQVVGKDEIRGFRRSKAWAEDQRVYFAIKFSSPFDISEIKTGEGEPMSVSLEDKDKGKTEGKNLKAWFRFSKLKGKQLMVKAAISAVSIDGAVKNLNAEIPDWNFDQIAQLAYSAWNKELGKIEVDGATPEQMTTFYSALYHTMVVPNLFTDVDGMYLGTDFKPHKAEGFTAYSVFSLWDTYRAYHPLMTIIDTKRTNDFINTFLSHYRNGGLLPVWELDANETFCMIGYHSIPVIVDAWMKGIRGFDGKYALEAMKHSSNLNHLGLEAYRKFGFIPGEKESESVSKTLEYSYDDWCISQLAKSLGSEVDYKEYNNRGQFYKNLFDPTTGFMRPRYNGGWKTPFDPREVDNNFTEANSWQYSFYVPQDITGLIKLHGGAGNFEKKIDDLFNAPSDLAGRNQADITGLIGQYAHGNEPSHHMAYLYNYVGRPWKTQKIVRKIMDEMYTEKPDGLCGNEDCGQMSAWYVLSSVGLYAVCPGNTQYAIGSPLFGKSQINLENGKKFTIVAENNSKNNIYIKDATLNGKPLNRSWIDYSEIIAGGELHLTMSDTPNKEWASSTDNVPITAINENLIAAVPNFTNATRTFSDSLEVKISTIDNDQQVFYTISPFNTEFVDPVWQSGKSIKIKETSTIKAYSVDKNGNRSNVIEGVFIRIVNDKKITLKSTYSNQYNAGGHDGLIDGIRGEKNFRLGGWQGYQGQDFEAIVDLGSVKPIHNCTAGFLQDIGPWIWFPKFVEFSISDDGVNFTKVSTVNNDISEKELKALSKEFSCKVDVKARYIKVFAKNYGIIPSWHAGAGEPSWLFVDEIVIE